MPTSYWNLIVLLDLTEQFEALLNAQCWERMPYHALADRAAAAYRDTNEPRIGMLTVAIRMWATALGLRSKGCPPKGERGYHGVMDTARALLDGARPSA